MCQIGALMGQLEAHIGQLKAQISQLMANLGRLVPKCKNIRQKWTNLEAEMSQLRVKMGQLGAQVGQLETELGQLGKKKDQLRAQLGGRGAPMGQLLGSNGENPWYQVAQVGLAVEDVKMGKMEISPFYFTLASTGTTVLLLSIYKLITSNSGARKPPTFLHPFVIVSIQRTKNVLCLKAST